MNLPKHQSRKAVAFAGFGLLVIAAVGVWGQIQEWWNATEFLPWAMLALIGLGLLLLGEQLLKFVNSVRTFEGFGLKLDTQEEQLKKHDAAINGITAQISTLTQITQTHQNQSVQIHVPAIPTAIMSAVVQQAQIAGAEKIADSSQRSDLGKLNIPSAEKKKTLHRPSYLQ